MCMKTEQPGSVYFLKLKRCSQSDPNQHLLMLGFLHVILIS